MKLNDCTDDTILIVASIVLVAIACLMGWLSKSRRPQPQTVLNLDEMARKWNATPTYFLATSNRVTVQDTTSYGITTLKIDPK